MPPPLTLYLVQRLGAAHQRMNKLDEADTFLISKDMVSFFCNDDNQMYRILITRYALEKQRFNLLQKLLVSFSTKQGNDKMDVLYSIICEYTSKSNVKEIQSIIEEIDGDHETFLSMFRLQFIEEDSDLSNDTFQKAVQYVQKTLFSSGYYFRGRLLYEAFRLKLDVDAAFSLMDRNAIDYVVQAIRNESEWGNNFRQCLLDWWHHVPNDAPSLQRYLAFHMAYIMFCENAKNQELDRISKASSNTSNYIMLGSKSIWQKGLWMAMVLTHSLLQCEPYAPRIMRWI